MKNTKKVTRFEVVDELGRAYTRLGVNIKLSLQDEGRTLKVFVKANQATQDAHE